MIYPENFEAKIGFDKIRELISQKCAGDLGRKNAENIRFSNDLNSLRILLDQTDEFKRMEESEVYVPVQPYKNLTEEISYLKLEGTYIEAEVLLELKHLLAMISECGSSLISHKSDYPTLCGLWSEVELDFSAIKEIERIIEKNGDVRDQASPELRKLRKDIRAKQRSVENKIEHHLSSAKKEGWLEKDTEIAVRYGRLVIPVPVAHKRAIRGFIHDESASGRTVYIEPAEIFDTNNDIRDLEHA
ncbi:MAG: hypothetical protein K8R53_09910 [Bacteroidales bacterium]|nr:hypothetical protein [Bacteroidales bacterium]